MNRISLIQEVNVKGTLRITQGFLRLVGSSKPAHIITVSSAMGLMVAPDHGSYCLSKLVQQQLSRYFTAESPNVTAISIHPGTVNTDIMTDWLVRHAKDTAELPGGFAVWLTTEEAKFLNGRYVSANWDADELVKRKEEIVNGGKLLIDIVGDIGADQFK
jgi:NAD(P)-dependent dehydrogenase (short-subunit alcohol dehydrogenase family)